MWLTKAYTVYAQKDELWVEHEVVCGLKKGHWVKTVTAVLKPS